MLAGRERSELCEHEITTTNLVIGQRVYDEETSFVDAVVLALHVLEH